MLCLIPSCGDPQQQSKQVLQARDFKFTVDDYMRAAKEGQVSSLRHFLEAGMAADARDGQGTTALFHAAQAGRPEAVAFLLQQHASPAVTGPGGDSPLVAAARAGSSATVKILLDAQADPAFRSEKNWTALTAAAFRGDTETVKLLAPVSQESLDEGLQIASLQGKTEVMDTLLAQGADVFSRSKDNKTPLMYAAANGHAEATRVLLHNGANRLALDSEERVAADYAAEGNHQEVIEVLADPSITGVARTKEPAALAAAEKVAAASTPGAASGRVPFSAEDEIAATAAPMAAEETGPAAADLAAPSASQRIAGEGSRPTDVTDATAAPTERLTVARLTASVNTPGTSPAEPTGEPGADLRATVSRPVLDEAPAPYEEAPPPRLQGARLGGDLADGRTETVREHVRMKEFRESQLPIVLEDVPSRGQGARIRVLNESRTASRVIPAGGEIGETGLELVKAERRFVPSKTAEGHLLDVSQAVVRDRATGQRHLVVKNVAAHSSEATALISAGDGDTYEVREGDEFSVGETDPVPYRVIDVRPTQVIVENLDTRETATLARAYAR